MPAAYANLYLEQGTTFNTTIQIDDVYGTDYDLTGYTVRSQVRKSYYSANATATFASSVNANTGTITLTLNAATTANIAAGRYVYDTLITNQNQEVTRILEGIVDVSPRVTR
jgi:L-lactate utilization protein LutB